MIDKYGRNITKATKKGEDIYTIDGGLVLSFPKDWPEERALNSIEAMAPEGYVPPESLI